MITYGLLNKDEAFAAYDKNEEALSQGIRVGGRIMGIIELDEIINQGNTLTIDEARKQGLIKNDFIPVVEARAFTIRERIADINIYDPYTGHLGNPEYRLKYVDKAKDQIAKELGVPEISDEAYIEWFCETLGNNLRMAQENGWSSVINEHNITLDCQFVDLASWKKSNKEISRELDNVQAISCLISLARSLASFRSGSEEEVSERAARYFKLIDSFKSAHGGKFR